MDSNTIYQTGKSGLILIFDLSEIFFIKVCNCFIYRDTIRSMDKKKAIIINGFTREETFAIMRAVKSAVEHPEQIAFCMGNENNREWCVKDLINEVVEEHDRMTRRS